MFILLLFAVGAFFLIRRGQFGPPPWAGGRGFRAPEFEAKRILAERFATGDISSDDFLERASVLNWTPGVEPLPAQRRKRR